MPLGTTKQVTATGTYSDGTSRDITSSVTWSALNPSVATVNSSGLLTAVGQGTANFTVSSGTISGGFTITVTPPVLRTIAITPNNSSIALGLTQQFSGLGVLTDNTSQTLGSITWGTSAANIASISSSGSLTTKAAGSVTITATSGAISGTTSFTVTPAAIVSIAVAPQNAIVAAGYTRQLTATATYTDGTTQDMATASWSTSDSNLATVSASGLVTTRNEGDVTVTATSASISGSAPLHIDPPVLVSLAVTPASATAMLGTLAPPKYTATGTYSNQTTADVSSTATWSVSDPNVVSVDASGTATPNWHGYSEVTASLGLIASNPVKFVGLGYPRYLLSLSDAGQSVNRATIDAAEGRVRWEGHFPMSALLGGFPCASTDPKEEFLYVTSSKDASHGSIDIRLIDAAKGSLTKLPATPVALTAPADCLQFEPSGNFAYAPSSYNNTNNQLLIFQKGAMGSISQLSTIPLPSPPSAVAIDPLGKYLYIVATSVTSGTPAYVYGYTIDSITGGLTAIPGTPFQVSNLSGAFSFSPSGRFIYLSNSGGESIDTYSVNRQTGVITPVTTLQTCVNASALVFAPSGDYAYATCSMDALRSPNSATVDTFQVNADGSLRLLGTAPTVWGGGALAIDPSGRFLYLNRYGNYLWTYSIDANGLASLDRKYGTHTNASNVLIKSGSTPVTYKPKFVFVSSIGDNSITSFAVAADGTFGNSKTAVAPAGPFSLTMVPWGNDLIVDSTILNGSLFSYNIAADGSLTTGGLNFGAAATSGGVLMDPSGMWAVNTDPTKNGVYTYQEVAPAAWSLVTYFPSGQPSFSLFPTQTTPIPMAMDAAGRFVYVGNQGSNSITGFHHWGTTMELIEATSSWTSPWPSGSPYPVTAAPVAMAADPSGAWLYVVCADQTMTVFAIDYNANGHLGQALLPGKPLDGATTGVAVTMDGRFAYTVDVHGLHAFAFSGMVSGTVISGGNLTEIALGPYATITNAKNVYADPAGKYLYVMTSSTGSGSVLGFEIQMDGTLKPFTQNPLATLNQPSSMTFATDIN